MKETLGGSFHIGDHQQGRQAAVNNNDGGGENNDYGDRADMNAGNSDSDSILRRRYSSTDSLSSSSSSLSSVSTDSSNSSSDTERASSDGSTQASSTNESGTSGSSTDLSTSDATQNSSSTDSSDSEDPEYGNVQDIMQEISDNELKLLIHTTYQGSSDQQLKNEELASGWWQNGTARHQIKIGKIERYDFDKRVL